MTYPVFKKGQPDAVYSDDGRAGSPAAEDIPTLSSDKSENPRDYIIGKDLSHAINAALILGMPLLVTGEPGTGKTRLGPAIAYELKTGPALKFETKSTSLAKDLFYTFDVLGRFGAKDIEGVSRDPRDYITYNALGRAILNAFPKEEVARLLPTNKTFDHDGPRRSLVVIDEIDKAPRDFPNDLLNEIEHMAFRVPELGNLATPGIDGDDSGVALRYRPIVVITSNSEKGLPDPFLRRCVYFDIAFPDDDELQRIVAARLPWLGASSAMLVDALALFRAFRERTGTASLHKAPSTAEFLNWLQMLRSQGLQPAAGLKGEAVRDKLLNSLTTLIKSKDDRSTGEKYVKAWLDGGISIRR